LLLIENATASSDSPAGAPRFSFRRYVRSLHLIMVSVLIIVLVAFVVVGWALRPPTAGFPSVPSNLTMQVTATGVSTMTERLVLRSDGRARLVTESVQNPQGPTKVLLYDLHDGHVCTPKQTVSVNGDVVHEQPTPAFTVKRIHQPLSLGAFGGPQSWTRVDSVGPGVDVYVCWSHGGPVSQVGAYLSAQFAPVSLLYGRLHHVRSVLILKGANTADYSIQSPVTPLRTNPTSWAWAQAASAQSIHLSAIDVTTSQHENHQAFLSGIALGIAGGALITILQELIAPFSRRKDERVGD
jgi:hypothetical protein